MTVKLSFIKDINETYCNQEDASLHFVYKPGRCQQSFCTGHQQEFHIHIYTSSLLLHNVLSAPGIVHQLWKYKSGKLALIETDTTTSKITSNLVVPVIPVITHPMFLVIWKMCDTVEGSISLSYIVQMYDFEKNFICYFELTGTFLWVTTTAVSEPLRPTEVRPPWLIALNAYSTKDWKLLTTALS